MKYKYNIAVILITIITLILFDLSLNNSSKGNSKRIPAGLKKVKQHIDINIDYQKLPKRNEIRLIGTVNANHLKSDVIEYKWILAKNLKLKNGSLTGNINVRQTNEITLDVAIVDMNKKINVKLEAFVREHKVKIGSVKSFTYDPLNEDLIEAENMEAQSKLRKRNMTKEDYLKQQLQIKRKISHQQ